MTKTIPVSSYTKNDGTKVRAHTREIDGKVAASGGGGVLLFLLFLFGANTPAADQNQVPAPAPTSTVQSVQIGADQNP